MGYRNNPFNPLAPTPNQVITELNQANNNFHILAQAFVSNNPETYKVKDADKVDDFHASLTPASNVIVPLNANGVLDLSATYVKSDVYTFRRVDLTGATDSYILQIGEEAIINFNNTASVPVRIDFGYTSSSYSNTPLYELYIRFFNNLNNSDYIRLYPNHTTYSGQFSHVSVFWNSSGQSGVVSYGTTFNTFRIFPQTPHAYMILDTSRNIVQGITSYDAGSNSIGYGLFVSKWTISGSSSVVWATIGTFTFPSSMSGYILVRRLF